MKKKIAVFASGWSGEYVHDVVDGICQKAFEQNMDVFAFVEFSIRVENNPTNIGECNILTLPDLSRFDGVIVLANSFNTKYETEYLCEQIEKYKLPAISIEYNLPGIPAVFTDNYSGMHELAEHVILHHGAKKILFIGGPENHEECRERISAVSDVAKANGVPFGPENIVYGDWSKDRAALVMDAWYEANGYLPDAVFGANDYSAMGVCEWAKRKGFSVPNDFIVTGYDCLKEALRYEPSITSVNHEWTTMGEIALELLVRSINGEQCGNSIVKTKMICHESCGCGNESEQGNLRYIASNSILAQYDYLQVDSHFRHIYNAVMTADSVESVTNGLNYLFEHQHVMEGPNFALFLNPDFFVHAENNENLLSYGYPEEMLLISGIKDEKEIEHKIVPTEDTVFFMADSIEKCSLYIFVPLFRNDKSYGYAMLNSKVDIFKDNLLYIWTRHLNQDMEHTKRNITIAALTEQLRKVSVTDALTEVYNRYGCEQIAYPQLADWKKVGGTSVVFLIDIDKMKAINDIFGHACGDAALKAVATSIKSEVPGEWIVARFGGDEFFVGGKLESNEFNVAGIPARIKKKLTEEIEKRKIEFPLSVSIGYSIIRPNDGVDLERHLQKADENMYSEKHS